MTTHNLYTITDSTPICVTPGKDNGFDITIQNNSTIDDIFIGAANVNSEDFGFKLSPGAAFSVELDGADDLYIVGYGVGTLVSVLRVNLERVQK